MSEIFKKYDLVDVQIAIVGKLMSCFPLSDRTDVEVFMQYPGVEVYDYERFPSVSVRHVQDVPLWEAYYGFDKTVVGRDQGANGYITEIEEQQSEHLNILYTITAFSLDPAQHQEMIYRIREKLGVRPVFEMKHLAFTEGNKTVYPTVQGLNQYFDSAVWDSSAGEATIDKQQVIYQSDWEYNVWADIYKHDIFVNPVTKQIDFSSYITENDPSVENAEDQEKTLSKVIEIEEE